MPSPATTVPAPPQSLPIDRPRGESITIQFEGEPVPAHVGEPVATALFEAGVHTLGRSSKYHRPRGPFCFDGHCASCMLRIDGRPNRRACTTLARDGMVCARQNAFPSADVDLLAAADWLFPEGMDHHKMMTGSRVANAVFLKVVREMGGSGTLPDAAPEGSAAIEDLAVDVCIVGAGPAGLAAARAVLGGAPGAKVVVLDEQPQPGGSLLCEPEGWTRAQAMAAEARAAGARLEQGATAVGYYPEDQPAGSGAAEIGAGPGVLLAALEAGLLRVRARRYLYATGAYDQNLPFADNDRPGVISARACGRLAFLWGIRPVGPKQRVVVLEAAPTGPGLARALEARGVGVVRVDAGRDSISGVRGAGRVRGVVVRPAGGDEDVTVDGDLVAVAALPAPASELPRQHGAAVAFDAAAGGFAARVDDRGATSAPGVYACGDVTGYRGTAAAARAGAATGRALGATLALLLAFATVFGVGCATPPPPPSAASPAPAPVTESAPPAAVQPPPFAQGAPATVESRADAHTAQRRAIFQAAWETVRDKHYDKTLGGVDWNAIRVKYEPLALGAPSDAAFYRMLNQMLGELGQSHMMVTGPGDDDAEDAEEVAAPGEAPAASPAAAAAAAPSAASATTEGPPGDPGITVRDIEGRPTITRVRAGSSADRAGLLPGFIVTRIAGRPLTTPSSSSRPRRPVEERFALRRAAYRRLLGPSGTRVSVAYLDQRDRPGEAVLVRDPPRGAPIQIGKLPPLYPEVRASEVGDVGVIAFNLFFIEPALADVKKAMSRFAAHHVRAVVLDLRGNPGGQGAMAIPVASMFVNEPVTLGTLKFRDFNQTFVAKPELGATPFTGPLAILTDEGTASTSEMLAAGLQESKRAVVVGDTTLGAVLPSVVEALPGGAVIQYPVADFKTPKGVLLEGRGVQPDRRVVETRAALKGGRDPVLDAALVAIRGSRGS